MSAKGDMTRGRDKLAERYTKHGDPRKGGKRPTSEEAHTHASKVIARKARREAEKG